MLVSKPNIFSYLDYRRFLGDYYAENKKQNPSFSLRYFGQMAGLRSYNYLKLVIEGKRNLTPTFLEPFAKALRL
ncbi:MAG: TIGR02147 family protein, partial [Deltaproteobacteria bacterium]|nr:TIGR02147 family protein [Deltaproteobacteria bacterium]